MNNEKKVKEGYLLKLDGVGTSYSTVASLFPGVRVLAIEGFETRGEATNVYTAQWIGEQEEDVTIATQGTGVVYTNTDLEVTFIVSDRYDVAGGTPPDVVTQHEAFLSYMTAQGKVWIRSLYDMEEVCCIALDEYQPTRRRLRRARGENYILGTLKMHMTQRPTEVVIDNT